MKNIFFLLRVNLCVFTLLAGCSARAQWREDFNGDLNPWHGDKACFTTEDGLLQSNGPEKASRLSLCRRIGSYMEYVKNGDSALCLEYGLQLDFVPSTTNFLRLYLLCGDTLLQDTSRALYLHLGMKSSANYWQLWQSGPDSATLLYQGSVKFSKQSQMKMQVRAVLRDSWFSLYYTLEEDESGYASWYLDGDSVEIPGLKDFLTQIPEPVTGPVCSYKTASRATLYAFTHVNTGPVPSQYTAADNHGTTGDGTGFDKFMDSLAYSIPAYGSVVINEVMFDPATGESRFAEIYNASGNLLSMRQWALAVPDANYADNNVWKYYPLLNKEEEKLLEDGSFWVAAKEAGKVALQSNACRENIHTVKNFPTLDAKSGYLRLVWLPPLDSAGKAGFDTVVLDDVFYSAETHHWLLSDTKGVSLERLAPKESGLDAGNWMSAAETFGYATPGCENSHGMNASQTPANEKGSDYFSLSPPLVTPNNDGTNDFTILSWDERLDGFACSITVHDGNGRKMVQLCNKTLLGKSGILRYDAIDQEDRPLRPGIYVLLIELVKPDGKIKRLRLPLAVG